ncbi:class Ib ribonucleoside-diphosphate reductase assembly flavoprotein NrdI [Citricoccus nitrophenolicus]|uniref:class Ib ribonucleoside-diphosphate reductase assembly flavoprotein NrdI n=1 Tax=Citricoccus nitrophenolicus TaxID=863575 RepID=UPI0039B450DD
MTSVVSERRPVDAEGPGAPQHTGARLIYFSSASGYTHRFISKLGYPQGETARLPLITKEPTLLATEPYVLVLPTYGGGDGEGAVPKQVIKFLNVESNRNLIRGVVAGGNTNFHEAYCLAGDIVARKCQVPLMYRFELMGTPEDVTAVREGLERFWG